MSLSIKFAHISDIHVAKDGDYGFMLTEDAQRFLAEIIQRLNALPDLDFVFINGDCLNSGHQVELERFQAIIAQLKKPLFIVPGNHDGDAADDPQIFTQRYFASLFNPQFAKRPATGQAGYFSATLKEGAQFIGLDTSIPGQIGGRVDEAQLRWLKDELAQRSDKLVILGVHHPLHPLCPQDTGGVWLDWFVCANGEKVQSLLDAHPAVQLVLCGHHHVSKVFRAGGQLHVVSPPLATYPSAYRLIELAQQEDGWRIAWQTYYAPEDVQTKAAHRLKNSDFALMYDPNDGQSLVDFARGGAMEHAFSGKLGE
ncbi:MAG TPA: hypothetical protein G4N96_04695 [Chloroflexi bacterium]|nr:hypothetical protein [Chloroflexota bacterium]